MNAVTVPELTPGERELDRLVDDAEIELFQQVDAWASRKGLDLDDVPAMLGRLGWGDLADRFEVWLDEDRDEVEP